MMALRNRSARTFLFWMSLSLILGMVPYASGQEVIDGFLEPVERLTVSAREPGGIEPPNDPR